MVKSASHAEMHNTYYARALCPNNMLRLPVTNANWQITATRFWNRNRQKYQEMDRSYQKLFHSEWQQVKCRAVTTETKAWHLRLWRRGTFAILFLLFPCFWKIKTLSSDILLRMNFGNKKVLPEKTKWKLVCTFDMESPRGGSVWIAVGPQKCYTKHIEWESKSVLQGPPPAPAPTFYPGTLHVMPETTFSTILSLSSQKKLLKHKYKNVYFCICICICVIWGTIIAWIEEVHTLSASSQLLESVIGLFIFSGCILSNLSAMISPKLLFLLYLEHKYNLWSILFISSEHILTNKHKKIQT